MKQSFLILLLLSVASFVVAQTPTKLIGTPIGSPSVDYTSGTISYTEHQPSHVFDGDYATYYASYNRSYTYVGLDLGTPHVITSVEIAPRQGWPQRVKLAVIQGANRADFSDAIALTIVPSALAENKMTTFALQCSQAFRYVRYVTPSNVRCNVAELAFYGYAGAGSATQYPQLTNLPTLNIQTTNNEEINSRENYVAARITIVSNQGTKFFTDSISIRGRGNASWNFPKKPYKFKLNTKSTLLDMPASAKDWTLINTYGDKTLMRNLVAYHFSEALQMPYTVQSRLVDVVLNGEYVGTYQLTDQKEVGKNRVEVEKMAATDVQLPELSGGYFVEWDAYAYDEDLYFITNRNGIPVTVKSPKADAIVPEQYAYLTNAMNQLVDVAYSASYQNALTGHRAHLESETFLKYQLVNELAGNTDTYWSMNLYKRRNDPLFYTGPVWDVDLGFDNDNRTYPINQLNDFLYKTKGSTANGVIPFVNRVMTDPYMVQQRKTIWADARSSGRLTPQRVLAFIDSLTQEINQSQQLNFERWDILNSYVHQNPRALGSFAAEVNALRTYVEARFIWMDAHLNYLPSQEKPVQQNTLQWHCANKQLVITEAQPGTHIALIDLQGKVVVNKLIQASTLQIALLPGIYMLKAIYPNEQCVTYKVMIH